MTENPWWVDYAIEVCHTGSRAICNPPPKDTDDDYLLLIDINSVKAFEDRLKREGFVLGGSMDRYQQRDHRLEEFPDLDCDERNRGTIFHSWKKDDLNLILTCSRDYYKDFWRATLLTKKLNLLDKNDRVEVFECICYDSWPWAPDIFIKTESGTR